MKKIKKKKKFIQRKQSKSRKRKQPLVKVKSSSGKKESYGFRDNYGVLHDYEELIFPIIYKNIKTGVYHAIGTGYFIHANGGFITAKHVLYHQEKLLKPCYAIQTLDDKTRFIREIVAFFPHPKADIGVGMLKGQIKKGTQPHYVAAFSISLSPPKVGDKISTYAFPKSEVVIKNNSQTGVFRGTWSSGEIKRFIPAGEHHLLETDSFETSMHIAARASGGPVLRGAYIIGVNSTGWDIEEGQEPVSNITPVHEILDLIIKNSDGSETTVRNLMEDGDISFSN